MQTTPTILIVDDTPAGRDTLEELLISQDYQLAFASNGPEALTKAAELTPDLILLDVMMPGMDGFEVCRRLRADTHLAEVPVVMVTALDDRDSRLQGLEAGADDFVSKPFDRAELRARVRTITRLNRYRRLLAERARFEWIIEQADDGYLLASDGDEIRYTNPKARLYLGLTGTTDKAVTKKFLVQAQKQYQCEPAEAWVDWPAQTASDLPQTRYLVRPESATARAYWLQVTVFDQPAGLESYRLIQLRDVTAQMSTQRDMRTFQDMLSHKLRTPLAHLTTSLEMLADEAGTPLSAPEAAHLSKLALKGARRLHEEITDILHYLNVSKVAQAGAVCPLAELPQLVAEISDDLGLTSVTVEEQAGFETVQIALSRRALEWALWEILENAKKFHPQQAPTVEVTTHIENQRVSLKVVDNGLILSPEQLSQVWAPYYQGEKYFTGEAAGMGLGLSTVASLIWEVGGTCRLYNRPEGPGVVVELILPRIRSERFQTWEVFTEAVASTET
jgi:DNA-binding response OmpR family regulator